jgi:hypothetical protein
MVATQAILPIFILFINVILYDLASCVYDLLNGLEIGLHLPLILVLNPHNLWER